ncbi:CheW-like domain-containing protein [Abditibacterium utsteinense]|uniref:CheW-like domain-containing protein n=1 Tax=Abditibacterium utsteinense TaxID=1960156 RepID=A0A2S8STT5_9BACT|nr:chemotaxis protein CheW [Abditibacterium utsteinense]PQV64215.1 CheW-like domain-containing protein [Abditibacterium utsteinense]
MSTSNLTFLAARDDLRPQKTVAALTFGASGQWLALPLRQIERVIAAVALSAWPDAPRGIAGVIDVAGRMVAVLRVSNLLPATPALSAGEKTDSSAFITRSELQRDFQQPRLDDHFLLVNCTCDAHDASPSDALLVALWAEQLGEVVSLGTESRRGAPWSGWQPMALPQGLVLLGDSATLLSDEQRHFARAMAGHSFVPEPHP